MDELSDSTPEPTEGQQSAAPPVGLLFGMFTFWAALLLAAAVYAVVALSPGLLQWFQLREQYHQNASQLLQLEQDVSQLERIRDSLEQDPGFREQQSESGSTLDRELQRIGGEQSGFRSAHGTSAEARQVFGPGGAELLQAVGRDDGLRRWLLWAAALIVLLAFTFLNPAGGSVLLHVLRSPAKMMQSFSRRYAGASRRQTGGVELPAENPSEPVAPQLKIYTDEMPADEN